MTADDMTTTKGSADLAGRRVSSVGLPREIKDGERRIVLEPAAVATLVNAGARVLVEREAGVGAGFGDDAYAHVGATIVPTAEDAWSADLVVKVKEPLESEFRHFRDDLILFCYLHLAACPDLARALGVGGTTAFAFETVTDGRSLPLLAPMSEIAGRVAPIVGAFYLSGGSGTLLGGAAGVPPARVVVIGMGVSGTVAARGARGLDAEVTAIDVDLARLRAAQADGTATATLASSTDAVGEAVSRADLVVGAALIPGAKAPIVVTADHVKAMRPGSVVVDLAVDQGGCIETTRPTSLSDPVYESHGVVHYCVTNVPGQYARTASRALSAAVGPLAVALYKDPADPRLAGGLNMHAGAVVHDAVAGALATTG